MFSVKSSGNFSKATTYLTKLTKGVNVEQILDKYGREGVQRLSSATPVDTGLTAKSWHYKITAKAGRYELQFYNSNIQNGVPIAIILQYGHGTGTGGWVQGRDYINPALRPLFDEITDEIWREVTKV